MYPNAPVNEKHKWESKGQANQQSSASGHRYHADQNSRVRASAIYKRAVASKARALIKRPQPRLS